MKADDLIKATRIWRACREQYPGWIIAPAEAREGIWNHTKYWLDRLPAAVSKLKPEEALLFLFEINWRTEIALTVLDITQAELITNALSKVNPSPSLLAWPGDIGINPLSNISQGELLEAWVELAFAVMREAREDFDVVRFDTWHARLAKVVRHRSQWIARWHYEKALFALWRFDFAALERALENWESQLDELPFWEAKRAALWAEFGEVRRAEGLAETALQGIRSRMPAGIADFRLLSQEGWAMRLLMALRQRGHTVMPEHERARFQQRFAALSRYECNPWEITEWVNLALHAPWLQSRSSGEEIQCFDPGFVTQRSEFDNNEPSEKVRPAFAFLRIHEQVGLPMRVGILTMVTDRLKTVPLWIAPFAFSLALATAIRAREETLIDRLLTRAAIGALQDNEANNLINWLTEVGETAIGQLHSSRQGGWSESFAERTLPLVIDALSRLVLRADPLQVHRCMKVAESVCRFGDPEAIYPAMKSATKLFERALRWSIPANHYADYLPNWLQLPLPSERPSKVDNILDRAEPLGLIHIPTDFRWKRPSTPSISQRIEQLILAVAKGSDADRSHASRRLSAVALLNGLRTSETRKFSEALWSRTSPSTKLPVKTNLRLSVLLRYCPLPEEERRALCKYAFLDVPFPLVRMPTGKKNTFQNNAWEAKSHLQSLEDVTLMPWDDRKEKKHKLDWTESESLTLVQRATEWWETELSGIKPDDEGFFFDFSSAIRGCAEEIASFIGEALLVRLKRSLGDKSKAAISLLDAFSAKGVDTIAARPAMIWFGIDSGEVEREIVLQLLGNDPDLVRAALHAFQNWLLLSKEGLKLPSSGVADAIIWKICNRSGPALSTTIAVIRELLERQWMQLSMAQIDLLLGALDMLVQETELGQNAAASVTGGKISDRIPFNERPYIRFHAAKLAQSVGKWFTINEKPWPKTIQRWQEAASKSSLPEIRRVWSVDIDL